MSIIQRLLGHYSLQTTEVYLEVGSQAMIDAVERNNTLMIRANIDKETNINDIMPEISTIEKIRLKLFK